MSSRLGVAAVALLSLWTVALLYAQFSPMLTLSSLSIHEPSHKSYKSIKPKEIRKNLWAEISPVEAEGLRVWLHQPQQGLNLTPTAEAGLNDNSIQYFEILRPNKTDVIPYLHQNGPEPPRYARVVILHGSDPDQLSTLDEYMVGPIPISAETTIKPLTYIYNSGKSSTKSRNSSIFMFREWMTRLSVEIYDIAHDLFNFTIGPDGTANFMPGSVDPFWNEDGRDVVWLGFYQESPARSLLAQGLYLKADITGVNASEWKILHWYYNGILYDDLDALKTAWKSPGFEKLPANLDGEWTELRPTANPTNDLPPPPKLQLSGPSRVFIDETENFVSWLNFSFNIGFSQVTALGLFDIRVDDERVFYELSFQEALAHYAGADPKLSGTSYLDSSFAFGALLSELIPGYDCPEYAHFLSTEYHRDEKSRTKRNTICVFEKPMDYPTQRHTDTDYTSSFVSTELVVRSISTIGNYDYLIDYIFYADGSIEVKVRASGYIQSAYALHNELYGFKVHDATSTAMHDHVINFKADLDVGGALSNTFQTVSVVEKEISYPWGPDKPRRTMVLEPKNITSESEGSLDWPKNSGSLYLISSPYVNKWGERRSYRMMPGTGIGTPPHLTMKDSSNLMEAARWAEHDVFVVRQHDTEPMSCSSMNGFDPSDPPVRFADFFADNEDLEDEDLVVYFNIGTHHIPHSGDIPNTVMTTSSSSVMFSPFNFWDRDRSMDWSKGVTITHPGGHGYSWVSTQEQGGVAYQSHGRGPGYWREDPESTEQTGPEDLRVRRVSRPTANDHKAESQPEVEFFGPRRSEEEKRKELESFTGFEGLKTGRMYEYMPMARDVEYY